MTQKQFLSRNGVGCPLCRADSINLEFDNIDISCELALQDVYCPSCKARWIEIYELKGFQLLYDPRKEKQ